MIYFITAREIGRVKIGYSEEPRGRFIKVRADSPVPLELERVGEGSVTEERSLHERFSEHRLHGEWFTLSPEIEDAMSAFDVPEAKKRKGGKGVAELSRVAGISPSYSSMILNGDRQPSRPLAIHIFRKTGWKHPLIADLTDEQMDVLEAVDPWKSETKPLPTQDAAA